MEEKLMIAFKVLAETKEANTHALPSLFLEPRKDVLKDLAVLVGSLEDGTMRGNANSGRVVLGNLVECWLLFIRFYWGVKCVCMCYVCSVLVCVVCGILTVRK